MKRAEAVWRSANPPRLYYCQQELWSAQRVAAEAPCPLAYILLLFLCASTAGRGADYLFFLPDRLRVRAAGARHRPLK